MICSYCETENEDMQENCRFCDAPLKLQRPKIRTFLELEDSELPFGVLSNFHTLDLLLLLRRVREERTNCYYLMRTVKKGAQVTEVDSDTLAYTEEEYRRYTARMKVLEGIWIDRMGYKPKRIDDKLLESLRAKLENL